MNNEFYKSYVDELRDSIQHGIKRGEGPIRKSNTLGSIDSKASFEKGRSALTLTQARDEKLFESLQPLSAISGKKVNYHLRPGLHPEFEMIKTLNSTEEHYICSVFIDVKRSMNLFRKYNKVTVANIINTIQRVAVHTTWYFDGYIQRYHGDGLFAYFGGRNISMKESVTQALTAMSFFSYFMQHDLRKLFTEQGIENMFTRIGMDIGDSEDVLWYLAGMGECSEVTTCSLYTSLASKLQQVAPGNGIATGDNIKVKSDLPSDLFRNIKDSSGKIDYYAFEIPEERFHYRQWDFNWETYLKSLPGIRQQANGDLFLDISQPHAVLPNINYLQKQGAQVTPWAK